MKGTYKAEYQLYTTDEKGRVSASSIDFEKDGYETIEHLKLDCPSLVEEQIERNRISDCGAILDVQIVELVGETEVYVDNDSIKFTIENGKMTNVESN